ncbi:MAG: hypothetical protein AAGJ73_14435 [Pseudomonadota bacterium]
MNEDVGRTPDQRNETNRASARVMRLFFQRFAHDARLKDGL